MTKTLFGRLSSSSSFIIHEEKLYQVSSRQAVDYLQAGSLHLGLVPGPTLAELEDFERIIYAEEILSFQKDYVSDALQQEIKSRTEIKNEKNVIHALEFILYDLMSYMIDSIPELGGAAGVKEKKTGENIIDEIIDQEFEAIEQGGNPEIAAIRQKLLAKDISPVIGSPNPGSESILGKVLGKTSIYVSQGHIYELVPWKKGPIVVLDGEKYGLKSRIGVEPVDESYYEAWYDDFRIEAIEQLAEQKETKDTPKEQALKIFAQRCEFRVGNLGYIRAKDHFNVYWEVPKHAMQNPLRPWEYIPYRKAKVCVRINSSKGVIYNSKKEFLIGSLTHPAVNPKKKKYPRICNMNEQSFGNDYVSIATQLTTAVNRFLNGLTKESVKSHERKHYYGEDANYWGYTLGSFFNSAGRLSRDEAVRQGYMITNEWEVQ
jgi:hypothetical protein